MKRWKKLLLLLLFLLIAASCSCEEDTPATGTEHAILRLAFDLDGCGVVFDTSASRALTTTTTEMLKTGVRFTVRAYKSEDGAFVDEGVYVITDDGSGAGTGIKATPLTEPSGADYGLYLTRGEYDLRFLSYNVTTEHPTVDAQGKTTVTGGKDLISTSLKNVLVRADKDGQTDFSISLKGHPFEHLCACVKAVFQIPEGQVVIPTSVSEMKIVLKNLYATATYEWSTGVLTPGTRAEASSLTLFSGKSITSVPSTPATGSTILAEAVSEKGYLIPLDESAPLKFDISMKIAYKSTQSGGGNKTNTLTIENMEHTKALLPGKAYNFVFSLSFYGDYLPTDLMLDVQDYVPVELNPDDAG